MQIQVALDRISLEQAIGIARATALHVDWVEMGTSLIKQYGLAGLQALVAAADPTPVLADLKAVDDVRFEFALAFDGGGSLGYRSRAGAAGELGDRGPSLPGAWS